MNLNNLTKNNNANVNNVLTKFYSKRSEELIENEREPEFTKNTILIPRRKISQLQNASGFFEAFIDRDFSNSNEYFDTKGNYILKKELLPETFYFYDKKLKKNLTVPILPYPKETSIQNDLEVKTSYGQNESKVNFEEFKKLLNNFVYK